MMHLLTVFGVLLCALQCYGLCSPQVRGVSQGARQTILDKHNELRAKVANGQESNENGNLPQASNMLQLTWDDAVAQKAQEWANKCRFEYDQPSVRGREYKGQNIALIRNQDPNPDWNGTIQRFYSEINRFDPNIIDSYAADPYTSQFTQVIWAKTSKIGCGYVRNQEGRLYAHLYGCFYLPGGNSQGQSIYQRGSPCSQCGGCGSIPGLCVAP